jgi:carboxypeptidase Taq
MVANTRVGPYTLAMQTLDALQPLARYLNPIAHLQSAASLLSWDQETYMPRGGGEARAEQIATLQGLAHERLTAPETEALLGQWLDLRTGKPLADPAWDAEAEALLRETWRDYSKARQLPNEFVRRLGKTCALAQQVWVEAKTRNDYSLFLPHLREIVALKKEEVGYRGSTDHPYDALLDIYEPGTNCKDLSILFDALKAWLVPFLNRIMTSPVKPRAEALKGCFDPQQQLDFGRVVLTAMGYDFHRGRLDLSAHPFTTSFHPTDVRITTRISEQNFTGSLFSCIHEGGHGLYDQGLPAARYGTALGESISLGIHESQSRLWENCVGRSLPFWRHFYPLLQKSFPIQLEDFSLENFYPALNRVVPSFIRVDADEVTYNLHIILRFEIERELLEGTVFVEDLPALWREKMAAYLGIAPPTDREGMLQDVHWSLGAIGYFPTYALGNFYAAQFFAEAQRDLAELPALLSRGELLPLKQWLNANIHRWGRRYSAKELVHRVTGQPLTLGPFMSYIEQKYSEIYRLKKESA